MNKRLETFLVWTLGVFIVLIAFSVVYISWETYPVPTGIVLVLLWISRLHKDYKKRKEKD